MIQSVIEIKVGLDFGLGIQPVGRLAIRDHIIYFEYNDEFIQKGIEISPFQSTMVTGEGKNPGISHLLKLGTEAKLSKKLIKEIIDQTKSALRRWEYLSENYNVSKVNIGLVLNSINNHIAST